MYAFQGFVKLGNLFWSLLLRCLYFIIKSIIKLCVIVKSFCALDFVFKSFVQALAGISVLFKVKSVMLDSYSNAKRFLSLFLMHISVFEVISVYPIVNIKMLSQEHCHSMSWNKFNFKSMKHECFIAESWHWVQMEILQLTTQHSKNIYHSSMKKKKLNKQNKACFHDSIGVKNLSFYSQQ